MKDIDYFLTLIKQTREEKGVSQRDIAKHLGITQPSYNHIESGFTALKVETLLQIATFLEIDLFPTLDANDSTKSKDVAHKGIKELNVVKQEVENINGRINQLFDLFNSIEKR